jgi:hypothetical protein
MKTLLVCVEAFVPDGHWQTWAALVAGVAVAVMVIVCARK